jgi:hypothetical protein
MDQHHCGACDQRCNNPGQFCHKGKCNCPPGKTMCGNWCEDLKTERRHCGRCNNQCANGFGCTSGVCDDKNRCPDGKHNCGNKCVVSTGSWVGHTLALGPLCKPTLFARHIMA